MDIDYDYVENCINQLYYTEIKPSTIYDNKICVTNGLINRLCKESMLDGHTIANLINDCSLETRFDADIFYNDNDKSLEINLYKDDKRHLAYVISETIATIIAKLYAINYL